MHSSVDIEPEPQEVLLELGLVVTEGRQPNTSSPKGFEEGPHCLRKLKTPRNHICAQENHLCIREESFRKHVDVLWRNNVPLCIEVLLCSDCPCGRDKAISHEVSPLAEPAYVLLEQWNVTSYSKRSGGGGGEDSTSGPVANGRSILHAVRSFLHFSQLSAWLAVSKGESPKNIMYRVTIPGENFVSKFMRAPEDHEFPTVQFKNHVMKITVKSLPRLGSVPIISCSNLVCTTRSQIKRSQSPPVGEIIRGGSPFPGISSCGGGMSAVYAGSRCIFRHTAPTVGKNRAKARQWRREQRNEKMLEYISKLEADGNEYRFSFSSSQSPSSSGSTGDKGSKALSSNYPSDSGSCYFRDTCSPSPSPPPEPENGSSSSPSITGTRTRPIPTLSEKIDFLKSLDTAASRLFHRKTGLPLTSSPAPLRKGQDRFDFDSSLVSATRITSRFRRGCHPPRFSEATRALLGPFEESVLNGRIEPVSTVQGFTAEIGASGSFCPRHVHLPVTVFFYTFCNKDKISTPYLAHVDLGEQGYCVPRKGTVQVTLFNPLRTVIKMFVVQFNLENIPNNSQTFLRQRTYFMPLGESDTHPDAQKWLRYLIHLRFASNNTGQIFLHTDIRMIIFRKSDADTATGFDVQAPHELRSFVYSPHNPQFSPRLLEASKPLDKKDERKRKGRKQLMLDYESEDSSTTDDLEEQDEYDNDEYQESDEEWQHEYEPCVNHSEVEISV